MVRGAEPSDEPPARPNHAYYRACHGAWRSPLSLSIDDAAALAGSGMRWADRLSLVLIAKWPRWLGRFVMDTTVEYDESGTVGHTTAVRWLGIPLMRSVERIVLHEDGRTFAMEGEQRMGPLGWMRRPLSGGGSIDDTGDHAEYAFQWLGITLRQTTVREPDRVTVTQRGPGFSGVQTLQRRG